MVQVISTQPTMSRGGLVGQALAQGLAKRAGIAEAEQAFQDAQSDPLKLATAFARLTSVSPELARGAGPMYEAMVRHMKRQAYRTGTPKPTDSKIVEETIDRKSPVSMSRDSRQPSQRISQEDFISEFIPREQIPLRETTPGIQEKSIVAEETLPRPYWSPEQRIKNVSSYIDMGFPVEDAERLSDRDEKAYLANPEQYQRRYELLEQKRKDAREELVRQLQTKTQKKGEELFKDIPGEYLIGMEKGLERDIRQNPDKTVAQIADEWSTRALNTAKAKSQFEKLAATTGIESLIKGRSNLSKLEQYGKIFEKSGNQEQYFNLLKDNMKLSPQGAASIAFAARPNLKDVISKTISPMTPQNAVYDQGKQAIKLANELLGKINPNDSLLTIAWEARKKNPLFNDIQFFEYLGKNSDNYNFNDRQMREIAEGPKRLRPYWRDILIFPWMGE